MVVGKAVNRVDATAKVTGEAQYCADMVPRHALTAKVLHSTIANGNVLSFDLEEAKNVPGVVKIVTCFDVPDIQFPTAGHPWSTEPSHQDIADRKLLNARVRFYGDEIAAVIAEDDISAQHALDMIKVKYEEYPPFFTIEDALKSDATPLHPDIRPTNVIVKSNYEVGSFDEAVKEPGLIKIEGDYQTPIVKHCHLEPVSSYAYMQNGKNRCRLRHATSSHRPADRRPSSRHRSRRRPGHQTVYRRRVRKPPGCVGRTACRLLDHIGGRQMRKTVLHKGRNIFRNKNPS